MDARAVAAHLGVTGGDALAGGFGLDGGCEIFELFSLLGGLVYRRADAA